MSRDPNAPKRARSAYIFYVEQRRSEISKRLVYKEGETVCRPNLTRLFGEEWRDLSKEKKDSFQKLADRDKIRYANEKAEYIRPETKKWDTITPKPSKVIYYSCLETGRWTWSPERSDGKTTIQAYEPEVYNTMTVIELVEELERINKTGWILDLKSNDDLEETPREALLRAVWTHLGVESFMENGLFDSHRFDD